jgi:hypothetical protein
LGLVEIFDRINGRRGYMVVTEEVDKEVEGRKGNEEYHKPPGDLFRGRNVYFSNSSFGGPLPPGAPPPPPHTPASTC